MDFEGLLIQAYHDAEHCAKVEIRVSYLLEIDLLFLLLVAEKKLHSVQWKQNMLPCKFYVIPITHQAADTIYFYWLREKRTNNSTFRTVYLKANLELTQIDQARNTMKSNITGFVLV